MTDARLVRLRRLHALREEQELRLLQAQAALRGAQGRLERGRRAAAAGAVSEAQGESLEWSAVRVGELSLLTLRLTAALRRHDTEIRRLTNDLRAAS